MASESSNVQQNNRFLYVNWCLDCRSLTHFPWMSSGAKGARNRFAGSPDRGPQTPAQGLQTRVPGPRLTWEDCQFWTNYRRRKKMMKSGSARSDQKFSFLLQVHFGAWKNIKNSQLRFSGFLKGRLWSENWCVKNCNSSQVRWSSVPNIGSRTVFSNSGEGWL